MKRASRRGAVLAKGRQADKKTSDKGKKPFCLLALASSLASFAPLREDLFLLRKIDPPTPTPDFWRFSRPFAIIAADRYTAG
jgi:hypothetical protein